MSKSWNDIPDLEAARDGDAAKGPDESGAIARNNVQALIQICTDWGVEVFWDADRGEWFTRFPVKGRKVIDRLRSEQFKDWLCVRLYQAQGTPPTAAVMDGALSVLTGKTRESGPELRVRTVFLRLGEAGGRFYLDLCNPAGQVVEIDAAGWRVLDDCPLWWWRPPSMKALPMPEPGGDLSMLRPFVNAEEPDFQLICGWLLASLNPSIEYPILAVSSEAGSGKSTLTALLKDLIDPDAAGAVAPFKNSDALFAAASSRHVVALDNLDRLRGEDADHFCRLATGGGMSQRKLYTNNEAFDVRLRRPLILNGISFSPDRADLLTRCFPVSLKPLNGNRRGGQELRRAFEEARPGILGALLGAVSAALRTDYRPRHDGRMADAVSFVMRAALGGGLPFSPEAFDRALTERTRDILIENVLDNPVGSFVYRLALNFSPDPVERTAEDLLKEARAAAIDEGWDRSALPRSTKAMGWALRGLTPALRAAGVEADYRRTAKERFWSFQCQGG